MRFLHHNIWGRAKGDFNPDQAQYSSGDNLERFLEIGCEREKIDLVFAPKCDFTNRIVALGEDDGDDSGLLVRTKSPADGGIISQPNQAVVIFNGDCPIVTLFNVDNPRLAVLHAGFRCLVPDNRKQRSIIKVAFDDHGFNPKTVKVFVGFGIGPCCYGAEHLPEVRDTMMGINLPVGRATRGPRSGKRSVDLYQLILDQLLKIGVFEENILRDLACSSCAKEQVSDTVDFTYYSHCRGDQGRNASLAWFVEQSDDSLNDIFGKTFRSSAD